MNSYFSVTGDSGRSTLRLFQEFILHFQFPDQPLGFAESHSLAELQRRLLIGVFSPGHAGGVTGGCTA